MTRAKVLLDEDFDIHVHRHLPDDKDKREALQVKNYLEALLEFRRLCLEVISYED